MLNDGLKLTGKLTIALNDEIVQEVPNLVVTFKCFFWWNYVM